MTKVAIQLGLKPARYIATSCRCSIGSAGGQFGFAAHIEYHPALAGNEAGSLIEGFGCFGLELVRKQAFNGAEPVVGLEA